MSTDTLARRSKTFNDAHNVDLKTNALDQLNIDSSEIVSKGYVTSKSPKKSKKSPKPAKKVAAKKVAVKKVAAKKVAVKKVATKKVAVKNARRVKPIKKKVLKPKRPHNTTPTTLDRTGICVGPARVRSVLVNKSLNPVECLVRVAIEEAENCPVRPKPTEQNPNPEMPEQGPQVNIEDMPEKYLTVIRRAEAVHDRTVREGYERLVLHNMTPEARDQYLECRKCAHIVVDSDTPEYLAVVMKTETKKQRLARVEREEQILNMLPVKTRDSYLNKRNVSYETVYAMNAAYLTELCTSGTFTLQSFNEAYDENFYNSYAEYVSENDNYVVKDGGKYNQWSRAAALVTKLSTRLSGNTRYIIASFLDRIVEQYAENGINNCLLEDRHIVKLRHALTTTEGFEDRVNLDCFVKTFKTYGNALNWIDECRRCKDEVNKLRLEKKNPTCEMPKYPKMKFVVEFDGYVGEICRSVRMRLARNAPDDQKDKYMATSVSHEFKKFCSHIIYEAILRIGAILKTTVSRDKVKTVSDPMVEFVLETIYNVTGLEFEPAWEDMKLRLEKFTRNRAMKKAERRRNKTNGDEDDEEEEEAEVEDLEEEVYEEDVVDDEEEVEVEVEVEEEEDEEVEEEDEEEDDADGIQYDE